MIRKILLVMSIIALGAMASLQAQELPKVTIIATGGTIAGSGTSKIQTNYMNSKLIRKFIVLFIPNSPRFFCL